ncbi:hypothetical protein M3Y99_00049700 [Aphelenchoides fujianensis]|nr:hypothetical protein M3Y99_00049700 [Aphelenchoides fujianensis]
MALSCGARMLKFLLFIFNLLFLLCGIVCVLIAVFLILNRYAIENLASAALKTRNLNDNAMVDFASKPSVVRQVGYALLIVGVAVVFLSFLGCCGAAKEWRPLLCCYATLLMAILAVEISFGIYAAFHSHSFENDFGKLLEASLKLYNGTDSQRPTIDEDSGNYVKVEFDRFMIEHKCCGIYSKKGEFLESPWYEHSDKKFDFPPACCPLRRETAVAWAATISVVLQAAGVICAFLLCDAGCVEFLRFEEDFRLSLAVGLSVFLVLMEVICTVMAARLFVLIKEELLDEYD